MGSGKIHPLADVQTSRIGLNTRVWQYCVVLPNAEVGDECNLCSSVFIENEVRIGNRVTIKNGAKLYDGVTIGDDVFIGPNVVFANDPFPRSKARPHKGTTTVVHPQASIGANAVILPGITIGREAMIAAGAVVTRNVPPFAVVKGNPGRITGFVDQDNEKKSPKADFDGGVIKGVKPVSLSLVNDLRGDLLVAELNDRIPFPVKRMFYVMNVPSHRLRGEHAHKECHQLLFCLQGSVWVSVDNGRERGTWLLERPDQGIHIAPMVWAAQYRYSQNAVLGVFASHAYDPSDYIRDYEEFLRLVKT